ncbi:hypothetical protein WJX84_011289 [Apatococcus fuscideae]|uniref:DNA2/NAM7 helicase-like C-terminal domain-containing protein n=1 Tax=Apatococcus fuscideae TaxID=2026836 RepID=A0AAW1TGF1_9CHLO
MAKGEAWSPTFLLHTRAPTIGSLANRWVLIRQARIRPVSDRWDLYADWLKDLDTPKEMQLSKAVAEYQRVSKDMKASNNNLKYQDNWGQNDRGLDISLFERLVSQNNMPMHRLLVQRRMRPEISQFIRPTIYPDLLDGQNVNGYPNVSAVNPAADTVALP